MRFLAVDDHLIAAHVLDSGHDADDPAALLENRPLFDVDLQCGLDGVARQPRRRGYPGAQEFLTHAAPFPVGQRIGVGERQLPGPYGRAHHRDGEATAFLVAPDRDLQRVRGHVPRLVQGLDDLESREYAVDAVEASAGRLGIEMTAGQHRRQAVIATGAAQEQVADRVDTYGAACGRGPAAQELPTLQIQRGQRLPVAAAVRRRADPAHRHQPRPEALAVDPQFVH